MSHQIITSELLNELSDEQQQMLVGGADFELSGSNFGNRRNILFGKTSSGPHGSKAASAGISNTVNTAAQDFLGLGGNIPTGIGALGTSPVGGDQANGTENGLENGTENGLENGLENGDA
jgi:hypothetical protein